MISANSRYASSSLATQAGTGKAYILPTQPITQTFQYSFYVVTGADRIDTIAAAFLGDPTQWFLIAQVNPELINFFNLAPGTMLRIPVIAKVI